MLIVMVIEGVAIDWWAERAGLLIPVSGSWLVNLSRPEPKEESGILELQLHYKDADASH
jgi:hypothetical protein